MSLLLSEFEELFDPRDIYAIQALASFYSGHYGRCSKAFLKLESLPSIPSETQAAFQEVAVSIFTEHPPADPKERKSKAGKQGAKEGLDGQLKGKLASTHCFASGRPLGGEPALRCKRCKHSALNAELHGRTNCPLCHCAYGNGGGGGGGGAGGAGLGGALHNMPIYEDDDE
jgi:WD repeat-containing protein 35